MEGGEAASTSSRGGLRDVDGCANELYGLLWKRDPKGDSCPGLHVQETVVFGASGRVEAWYFTSKKTSQILKKHSRHCTAECVLEEWSKEMRRGSRSPTDCVACLLYPSSSEGLGAGSPQGGAAPGPHLSSDVWTNVEFLDWFQAEALLSQGKIPSFAVLQKAASRGAGEAHHSVICATWSPSLCLVERRTNCNKMDDTQVPLHERMTTFEGRESCRVSTSAPLSGTKVAELVQGTCRSIVEHVREVSNGEQDIVRLVAYFKVEANFQVSFLWSSSLRLKHRIPDGAASPSGGAGDRGTSSADGVASGTAPIAPPRALFASLCVNLDPNVRVLRGTTPSRRQGKRVWRMGNFSCPSCAKTFDHRERCEVMYKTVICHHERHLGGGGRRSGAPGGLAGVPPVLAETEGPSLDLKRYAAVADNPAFLYKVCHMCVDCCLEYTSTALEDLGTANPGSTMVGMTKEYSGPELETYNILSIMVDAPADGAGRGEEEDKRRRPQSASVAQEKGRHGDGRAKVLRARPNSALARRKVDQGRLAKAEQGGGALEPRERENLARERKIWSAIRDHQGEGAKEEGGLGLLEEWKDEESDRGSEGEGPDGFLGADSSDIPLDRFMKINDLTAEELDYLRTVL